jgi:hypothetical protein
LSEGALFQLKSQTDERQRVVRHQLDWRFFIPLVQGHVLDFGGVGKEIADGV